eukprot:TRINITY_DN4639_c0_g1_i2.p1 TRINITY_DN4639_c0_g1~~TRINITY_DN4639_c0_g1_i2.p1  ORF type:complete len:861 (-),score=174.23 TRINITY_DN4639_c0_g1_i2:47-2629(-)
MQMNSSCSYRTQTISKSKQNKQQKIDKWKRGRQKMTCSRKILSNNLQVNSFQQMSKRIKEILQVQSQMRQAKNNSKANISSSSRNRLVLPSKSKQDNIDKQLLKFKQNKRLSPIVEEKPNSQQLNQEFDASEQDEKQAEISGLDELKKDEQNQLDKQKKSIQDQLVCLQKQQEEISKREQELKEKEQQVQKKSEKKVVIAEDKNVVISNTLNSVSEEQQSGGDSSQVENQIHKLVDGSDQTKILESNANILQGPSKNQEDLQKNENSMLKGGDIDKEGSQQEREEVQDQSVEENAKNQIVQEDKDKEESFENLRRIEDAYESNDDTNNKAETTEQKKTTNIQSVLKTNDNEEKNSEAGLKSNASCKSNIQNCDLDQEVNNIFNCKDDLPNDFDTWFQEKCIEMLQNNPNNHLAHYKLHFIYRKKQDFSNSMLHLKKVQEIDPQFKPLAVSFFLGELQQFLSDFETAIKSFKSAYKLAEDKYPIVIKLGDCYYGMKNKANAQKAYQQAIVLNPNGFEPYLKLGKVLIEMQQYQTAADNLQKAYSLAPTNSNILVKLAETYLEINELDKAFEYVKKAQTINPDDGESLLILSKIFEKKQKLDKAIEFGIEAIQKIKEVDYDAQFYLGKLYLKKKDIQQASEIFKQILKKDITYCPALIEYATIINSQGDPNKALKYFKQCLKVDPNNIECLLRLGKLYQIVLNDLVQSENCYKKVLELEPTNSKAHFRYGTLLTDRKEYKKAINHFKETLKLDPRFSQAWKAIGNIFYQNNSNANALKYYQRALESNPDDLDAKIACGNCFYSQENIDQAIKIYEEVASQNPTDQVEYNLANCYYQKGEIDEAIYHYQYCLLYTSPSPRDQA